MIYKTENRINRSMSKFAVFIAAAALSMTFACKSEPKANVNKTAAENQPSKEDLLKSISRENQPTADKLESDTGMQINAMRKHNPDSKLGSEIDAVPDVSIEIQPSFQGGNLEKFVHWVNSQIIYPQEARIKGIEGTVYVTFVIEKDGRLTNAKIWKSANNLLDKEVLRVLKLSPVWEPGRHRLAGKTMKVPYILPIKFQLE